jgi:Glycosyltransferase family 87
MSKNKLQQDPNKNLASSSSLKYVLAGFLITYMLFFICPVFLNSAHLMQYYAVVPRETPIGIDFKQALIHCEELFIAKTSPYTGSSLFPPLTYIIFGPFLAVDLPTGYLIITIISIICYIFITFLFPFLANRKPVTPLLMLIFISGMFSYGFQFEVERGQFNVISMFLSLSAVLIYHNYHRFRYLAYCLFSIGVQFKIYPAIFIFMFVRDWKDWKNNIKRFLGLGAFNLALLFALGPRIFVDFVMRVKIHMIEPFIWIGNSSIKSFTTLAASTKFSWWAKEDSGLAQFLLFAFVTVCIFLIIIQAYRQNQNGINPYLLLACTIGAVVIPSESHDYKLSILVAPVALLFHSGFLNKSAGNRLWPLISLLIFLFSVAYSTTLYPYNLKPLTLWLLNNFPALMILLFITTLFSFMTKPGNETHF